MRRLNQASALEKAMSMPPLLCLRTANTNRLNFYAYLRKHRHRIVSYEVLPKEQICSIGSGAVESAVKQIDRR